MHIPKHFQQDNSEHLKSIILEHPFATLVSHSEQGLEATHLPFILNTVNNQDVLQGHIAKANPLWENLSEHSDVLIVFNGPNCYISPNHYPTKKEHGKAVPTWNYVAVHVKGKLSFIHDESWNLAMLEKLTHQHEATQESPWSLSDAPEAYIQKMMPAIVGLEICITSITGQWKVSQNQPEKNQRGVACGLNKAPTHTSDEQKIAALINHNLASYKK